MFNAPILLYFVAYIIFYYILYKNTTSDMYICHKYTNDILLFALDK